MTRPVFDRAAWLASLPPEEQAARRRNQMRITPFQARAALIASGLMPQVEAMMAQADAITTAAWEYATEFRRTSPTLITMAQALGMTDEQLDALFDQASTIEA